VNKANFAKNLAITQLNVFAFLRHKIKIGKMQTIKIIRTAWRMVNHTKGLAWYGVLPAIFTTTFGIGYIFYQFLAFESSPFFGNKHFNFSRIAEIVFDFAEIHHFFVVLFFALIVIGTIAYFIFPPFCQSAIIGIVSAIFNKKEVRANDGIAIGVQHFLKMFELQMLVSVFSFFEFLTVGSLTIRKLGTPAWLFILLGFLFFVSFILGFLFVYAQNFVVLKNRDLIPAFMGSAKLVVSNFRKTLSMWFLIFLISIRVVINVILIFFIPALVVFLANFFVSTIALSIGIFLAIVVGIIVLGLAAYLGGVLHVFTTTAWTLTFLTIDHERAERLIEK